MAPSARSPDAARLAKGWRTMACTGRHKRPFHTGGRDTVRAGMTKPFVVVATPCFGGLVNQGYMLSVLKLLQQAAGGEFELDIVLLGGDSLITRSRSVLVSRFLDNPRATHLMFIDADIAFEPRQFLRLLRI